MNNVYSSHIQPKTMATQSAPTRWLAPFQTGTPAYPINMMMSSGGPNRTIPHVAANTRIPMAPNGAMSSPLRTPTYGAPFRFQSNQKSQPITSIDMISPARSSMPGSVLP